MAIAPIDLQTLFTQVEKVGKAQAAQKEGQTIQQAIQGVAIQRKTDEQIQQVNETQDMGEGTEKVNDRSGKNKDNQKGSTANNGNDDNESNEEKQPVVFRDPRLGNKIDISL